MSWRETLGFDESGGESPAHNTHNTHNTQKPVETGNCADIADSASPDAGEAASKLLEALSDACRDLPITPAVDRCKGVRMGVVVKFARVSPRRCKSCEIPMAPTRRDPLCDQCRRYVRMYEGLPGRGPGGDAA